MYSSVVGHGLLIALVLGVALTKASTTTTTTAPSGNQVSRTVGEITIDNSLEFLVGDRVTWSHDVSSMADSTSTVSDAVDCSVNGSEVCLEWTGDRRLTIQASEHTASLNASDDLVSCYDVEWTALSNMNQVLTDCYDVSASHWYGGYEDTNQYWPFEKNSIAMTDYNSKDGFWPGIGNVLERYFVSSSGVGIFLDNDVPLYFSLNDPEPGKMCFSAQYQQYPYKNPNSDLPYLKYTMCKGGNVKDTHLAMAAMFIEKPTGIPNEDLFRYPIWSTWAQYHYGINQANVVEYAENIMKNNFTCAQVEIDDVWTPFYGDYTFDTAKFPNATVMIDEIKALGYKVTVWCHPFFNNDGEGYREAAALGYLIKQVDTEDPQLTEWWNGKTAGILDVTNQAAVKWYLGKMENLKTEFHVDSFKFDAGELTWVPSDYKVANMPVNPCDMYPKEYVKMAAMSDLENRQEVRSGYKSQDLPIFVRQIDKRSLWTGEGAYDTILPGVLTMGLIGYPFVLPDMVGGNAYGNNYPESELFIRWMQLNTFLPSVQFSIAPWDLDSNVIEISRKFMELHTAIADSLIHFAQESVLTGEPIIRPLWWIDPENETALVTNDEYLLGDQYLVAPIMKIGQRSRDIYIPTGDWLDMKTKVILQGPLLVENYDVPLDELPYFQNTKYVI